ncbi:MAG: hypothetical protein JNM77_08740 [Pseudonocardia sp.]|nr:hypothetical protein [Pseudonocardia sp.]
MGYTAGQKLRASQLGPVPCTSTTRPAGPHEGLLIVESDTGMTAIYSGSAWRYLAPTGAVSTHGEYNQSGTQSAANASGTRVAFGNESTSTPLVTRAADGAGHKFTLNRSGLWSVTLSLRTSSANGERHGSINDAVGEVAANSYTGNGFAQLNVALVRHFSAGAVLTCNLWQSTGGSINIEGSNGQTRLHIAWIHS